ncbi:DUF1775 domain-containing protein [Nitratireductor sp. ZSWI3]|uniref:DUF1775 domain-containing protein n=1 Tax=Nitratireductor sp. ZSWI3 TaxID=2966359 RepID=UPI00214F79D6|nr:DUF1775 domain-containing protein [Nitratireductor sp. ZSWI3]MCR4265612.1 DUF1775 domain-containing protein [Nitratireductor sp. ZSWI3]
MRHLALFAAATALPALFSLNAAAHAVLETPAAAAGSYKAVVTIPHGCDGQATNSVRVELPEGFVSAKPMPKPGWALSIEEGAYAQTYELHGKTVKSGVTAVTWSGGDLPDGAFDEFALRGTIAGVEPGRKLFFKTVQTCADGEVAWVELPAAGQDAHALEHPAPGLTILASDTEHAGHGAHGDRAGMAGDLKITGAWARAMLPGQPSGGGYLSIENTGSTRDRLLSVSSPLAGKVEVHTMEMKNEVMVMRPVEGGIEIPAGETVTLEPGGLHIMFMQVGDPFKEGGAVPVTLEFEKAGTLELELPVGPARGGMPDMDHSGHGK